jgi:spore coat protein A, manganese oxidase
MDLSRRDVLKLGVLGSAALLLPIERVARTKDATAQRLATSALPDLKYNAPLYVQPAATKTPSGLPNVDFYEMTMRESAVNILNVPGGKKQDYPLTRIWGYNGESPGPQIHVEQGVRTIVRQINGLAGRYHPTLKYEPVTSVHLHGSASLPEYDGYASDTTWPEEYKDYHYPNIQDARTLWYHDHGVHETAPNAYMGLAAQYQLHDPWERGLGIPVGPNNPYDVGLTVRDAIFGVDGQLIYNDNSQSSVQGDVVLVNGRPWPTMGVEPRKYRFRILNASVSRSYRFALTQTDMATREELVMTMIATDGGLMPTPQPVTSWRHGMAERYEVIIDFAPFKGKKLFLKNLGLPNNVDYASTRDVMQFEVGTTVTSTAGNGPIPSVLNPNTDVMGLPDGPVNHRFQLVRTNGSWTINGSTWVNVINSAYGAPLCSPKPGATEIWEIQNPSGGWFHPFHIHLVDFKIISRNGKAPYAWEKGPKDVVYVGENETVRLALKLAGPDNPAARACYAEEAARLGAGATGQRTGRYMMHCHNLVHEDHDMMGQFWVGGPPEATRPSGDTSPDVDPHHPMKAAPAQPWDDEARAAWGGRPDTDNFKGF